MPDGRRAEDAVREAQDLEQQAQDLERQAQERESWWEETLRGYPEYAKDPDMAAGVRDDAAALREHAAQLRSDAATLRGDADAPDHIMAELDSRETRIAQVAAAVGGGSPAEPATRIGGGLVGLIGAFLVWQALQSVPGTPGVLTPGPVASDRPAPSAAASAPAARPSSAPSGEPITQQPVNGTALGLAHFVMTGGDCPQIPEFDAVYDFEAVDGALTKTQLQVNHVSTGEIGPDGAYSVSGVGQEAEGQVTGTSFSGTLTDTTGNCTAIFGFRGGLTHPFVSGPPFGNTPAFFEVFNPLTNEFELGVLPEPGQPAHLIVASGGSPDIRNLLAIDIVGTSGGVTFWDVTIPNDPVAFCRDATGCSIDAPTPVDASWANDQPVIVATGSGGEILAVLAPNGIPAQAAPTPTPSPTPASTAPPDAAAPTATQPAAGVPSPSDQPTGGTPASDGAGPNIPLAALGSAMVLGGGAVALRGPGLIGVATRRRDEVAVTPIDAIAAQYIASDVAMTPLVGRPWKVAYAETRSGPPIALLAVAVAVLALAVLAGIALASGFFGGGQAAPSATPIAQATVTPPSTPVSTPEPATPEPTPPPSAPAALANNGVWDEEAATLTDLLLDLLYSIAGVEPGYTPGYVDIAEYGATVANASQEVVDAAFNATTFDCTQVVDGVLTACASGNPIEPGPIFVAYARMDEPIPQASTDGLLTYALVLDSDGDPANNFAADPDFTYDFYQGTDRWYELVYTPQLGWYLTVDRNQTISNARVAIVDELVAFFIPLDELPLDMPSYRLTAFASSDATLAPEASGGDVAPGPADPDFELEEPHAGSDAAAGFMVRLGRALATGDQAFVFDRMHPAVLDRYGEAACRGYAAAVIDPTTVIEPEAVSGPEAWDYVTDGLTTTIPDAYSVGASAVLNGQSVEADFHVAIVDATFRWFTDCGTPGG